MATQLSHRPRRLQKSPPPGYYENNTFLRGQSPESPTSMNSAPTVSSFSNSRQSYGSTVPTEHSTIPSSPTSDGHSCAIDADDWFARFRIDADVTDEIPSDEMLAKVGDIPLYDASGNSRTFKSLYSGDQVIGERQLIVFVRHFYCGACQAYLKALTTSIDPQTYFTMSRPTSIIIIGCGSPSLIPAYKSNTGTVFPIFADPSRQLYKGLGMGWTLDMGRERPEYMKDISIPQWVAGQMKQLRETDGLRHKMAGGNPFQIGGEFLFGDQKCIWAHRMKNYRNHAEVNVIRCILEIDD